MKSMLVRLKPRSVYDVMALIACVAAVGTGTAYAANTVFSADIVDGEVKTPDLAVAAVGNANLGAGVVGTSKLGTGVVNSQKIADESVTSDDLGIDSVGATEIADSTIDTGEIVDNSLFSADLASSSVGNSELAANAVDSSKVAANTLTTADIAGADVSGHVNLSGIANGRCTQVTFGVSGAQVGQVPLVSTGAAIQNGILIYAQRVASAGHVEVNACNFSGTAMTAISNFPVRVITFG